MQKKLLATLGTVIIIVAVLLFVRERFGINLNPLSYLGTKTDVKTNVSDIEITTIDQYKKLPVVYKQGETVEVVTNFKNTGNSDVEDTITFKAFLIDGVWDSLKRDIKYTDRKGGALVTDTADLFTELDLLQMTKEVECVEVNGNCYENINANDSNNKFGGIEVKFEEPKYEIKFDSTITKGAQLNQKISFVPESCGYYMLVVGNKKYWSSAGSGNSKVGFIAVSGCDELGKIASGVSDIKEEEIVQPEIKDANLPVKELPEAGAGTLGVVVILAALGLGLRRSVSGK